MAPLEKPPTSFQRVPFDNWSKLRCSEQPLFALSLFDSRRTT